MKLIDLHAHLDFETFDEDREKILDDMKKNNIFCLSNTLNRENYEKSKRIFKNSDVVKVCPGLYPQETETITDEDFNSYLELIKKDDPIAIGEVGLDRHHTKEPEKWEIQEKRFRQIIEFAIEIDKPLIIHTRKAEQRVLEILEEYVTKTRFNKFDLHCFTGKKKLIKKIKELNIYCSIPLAVLNTESFRILVDELPMRQILIETDSPFLNPDKERNTPLNIPRIYDEIAKIKGYDKKEIENIIYRNYMKFIL